jgi:hypothetical protein
MSISIGTKIGAMIAHFAEALAMAMLMNDATRMNATINGMPSKPIDFSSSAPLIARITPRFDQLKNAMKSAAVNARRIYPPSPAIASVIIFATSLSPLIVPVTIPYASPGTRNRNNNNGTMLLNSGT